jgi:hypothetical protein
LPKKAEAGIYICAVIDNQYTLTVKTCKMKKKIVILMTSSLLLFGASYANGIDSTIPAAVTTEFSHDFVHAKAVKWETFDYYFKVTFAEHGKLAFAFYTGSADLMGIANNLRSDKLPVALQTSIKRYYGNYWITDLFRYRTADDGGFFVTLENADKKIILKSSSDRGWDIYKVTNKAD